MALSISVTHSLFFETPNVPPSIYDIRQNIGPHESGRSR
jgi:hypothetical protein